MRPIVRDRDIFSLCFFFGRNHGRVESKVDIAPVALLSRLHGSCARRAAGEAARAESQVKGSGGWRHRTMTPRPAPAVLWPSLPIKVMTLWL